MQSFKMNTVLLFMIVAVILEMGAAAIQREPRCPKPPSEGWPQPAECDFGIVRDVCGKPSCAVGPGGICKYKRFSTSNCGEGTVCLCSKCMGCSLHSYSCFESTCVFAMATRRR